MGCEKVYKQLNQLDCKDRKFAGIVMKSVMLLKKIIPPVFLYPTDPLEERQLLF